MCLFTFPRLRNYILLMNQKCLIRIKRNDSRPERKNNCRSISVKFKNELFKNPNQFNIGRDQHVLGLMRIRFYADGLMDGEQEITPRPHFYLLNLL